MKNKDYYKNKNLDLVCDYEDRKHGKLTYVLTCSPLKTIDRKHTYVKGKKGDLDYKERKGLLVRERPQQVKIFKAIDDNDVQKQLNEWLEREYRG